MKLRNYQIDSINNTRSLFRNSKRVLTVLPCGAGKTIEFAYMCSEHIKKNSNNYVWFLVHRQELIDQTIDTFIRNNIPLDNILIAMVQTVTRHISDYHKPTMIVFDECHHATAKTWTNILDYYKDVPVIGLTATPCRLDGKSLDNIFQSMTVGISTKELIKQGYLCQYDYYAPNINLEDAQYKVKGSDYDMKSVQEQFDSKCIFGDVIKYIDINKKTIIYAPTIEYSIKLSEEINTALKCDVCRHFDGNTDKKERKQIIEDFRNGKIRILTNVNLIGEGFDVPDCDCCMLLRPTMSVALYIQQSMRCMRPKPGKRAVIYDFVGNVYRHGLPDDEREWSLNAPVKMRNKTNDKELLVRMCKHCFRIYKGNARICPYCLQDNGKTKKQIEEDKKAELERITAIEKKKERIEVGMCRDMQSLIALGRKRGYQNPVYWARQIMMARQRKLKNY